MQIDPINAMAKRLNETAWSLGVCMCVVKTAMAVMPSQQCICVIFGRENVRQRQEVFYFYMRADRAGRKRQCPMQRLCTLHACRAVTRMLCMCDIYHNITCAHPTTIEQCNAMHLPKLSHSTNIKCDKLK